MRSVTQSCLSAPQVSSHGPASPVATTRIANRSGAVVCDATVIVSPATAASRQIQWRMWSSEEEREQEDPNHQERHTDLDGCSDGKADPRGDTGLPGLPDIAIDRELADHRADKRPDDDAWQPEEESTQRAKAGADHGAPAGTELLRAERGGNQVHE